MWVHPHLEWVEKAYRPSKCYQMLLTFSPLKSGLHLNYWHADDKSYIPSRISWVLRRIVCVRDASEWVMGCHSLNEEGREKKKKEDYFGWFHWCLFSAVLASSSCHCFLSQGASSALPVSVGAEVGVAAQHPDPPADLLRALWPCSGCTNLLQARGTSPHCIFSTSQAPLHPIYICTENGFYLCCPFLPLTLLPKHYLLLLPLIPPSHPVQFPHQEYPPFLP